MTATEDANKALVIEAFDALFTKREYSAAGKFWSSGPCTTWLTLAAPHKTVRPRHGPRRPTCGMNANRSGQTAI